MVVLVLLVCWQPKKCVIKFRPCWALFYWFEYMAVLSGPIAIMYRVHSGGQGQGYSREGPVASPGRGLMADGQGQDLHQLNELVGPWVPRHAQHDRELIPGPATWHSRPEHPLSTTTTTTTQSTRFWRLQRCAAAVVNNELSCRLVLQAL